jgi:hypothetical protein
VPLRSTGPEPELTSRDQFGVLNAGERLANVRVTVLYARRREIGPFRIGVAAQRVRQIRVNDLIFPQAVRLGEPYGMIFDSDVPVVVQCTRQDTGERARTGTMSNAWPVRGGS